MAANYQRNEFLSGNPENSDTIQEHSRNLSTVSCTTIITNTTSHSQPDVPLLPTAVAAPPTHRSTAPPSPYPPYTSPQVSGRLRWGDTPALSTDTHTVSEKSGWESITRESTKWQWAVRVVLDVVIIAWSIYNTIRYFIAFTKYNRDTMEGQSFSFALGTCSGAAIGLVLCSKTLFLVKHRLRVSIQSFSYFTRASSLLRYLSSLCILSPAIINFLLIFLWQNSPNPRYLVESRCHTIAIDILWSVSRESCSKRSSSWGIWLAVSSVRLALTSVILVVYHILAHRQSDCPQRPLHHRLRSESYPSTSLTPADSTAALPEASPSRGLISRSQNSDATLRESYRPPSRLSRAKSQSSNISDTTIPAKSLHGGHKASQPESTEDDHDTNFNSLLNQIVQETDEAVEFATSNHTASPETTREHVPSPTPSYPPGLQSTYVPYGSDDDDDYDPYDDNQEFPPGGHDDNIYNLPPVPPVLGYNEFGMPYPPDQDMRILNGLIRRMPTIESMGSGEVSNSITSSTRPSGSTHTSSRPPTRNTLLSFTSSMDYEVAGSAPPSRANSLSARAELLVGMSNGASEHGELLARTLRQVSSPTSYLEFPEAVHGENTQSSAGSRSTMSYHTATMGSSGDAWRPTGAAQ